MRGLGFESLLAICGMRGNSPDDVLDHKSSVLYCSSSVPAVLAIIHHLYVRRFVANSLDTVATVGGRIRKSLGTNRRWYPAYVRLDGSTCPCSDLYVEILALNIN